MSALDPHTIASKIVNAVEALDELGMAPSHATQIKASELIGASRVYREPYRSLVYSIEGAHAVYDVLLFVDAKADAVVSARCPCSATTSCSHLTAALAVAQVEGYSLSLQPGA